MENFIVWFEIPVMDFQRAKEFYEQIFEIEIKEKKMGEDLMGFFPAEKGNVSGAIIKAKDFFPGEKGVVVYLNGGENLKKVEDKIESAGGKVLVPKTLITEEIGYYCWFKDTEGNRIALWSKK